MAGSLSRFVIMGVISVMLVSIAKLCFPVLGLIALAPFFVVLKGAIDGELKPFTWLMLSGLMFSLVFIIWRITAGAGYDAIVSVLFYSFTLTLAVSLFLITDRFSRNRLGLFTIGFFWLGYDYLILKLYPQCSVFFLGNVFDGSSLVNWSRHTGFMGITLWILIANLLFYYVIFKGEAIFQGRIRWLSLSYTLIIISIPVVISVFFLQETDPVTWHEMIGLYVRGEIKDTSEYTQRGEWLGRTAAWVSVLLLIYSLVKQRIK